MRRYTTAIDILNGQPMVVPSDVGEYVRHDDPAIQASINAMEYAMLIIEIALRNAWSSSSREESDNAVSRNPCLNELRDALAGLKGGA